MRYVHMVDATRLAPIWFELAAAARYYFLPTLEDTCQATARRLSLAPPVITHGVDDMFREVRFVTRDCVSLIAGARTFLFVAHTAASAEKLRTKERPRDNTLRRNVHP